MKLPEYISFETPELALVAAEYLERVKGLQRDLNIRPEMHDPKNDRYFWSRGYVQLHLIDKTVTWWDSKKSPNHHFTSFPDFVRFVTVTGKMWQIGCRKIRVGDDGKSLFIEQDKISIPKSVLEEMLGELK